MKTTIIQTCITAVALLFAAGCHSPTCCTSSDRQRTPIVYCEECGIIPGRSTTCIDSAKHSFEAAAPHSTIYCTECGATPGLRSKCLNSSGHRFEIAPPETAAYCAQCGAAPSKTPSHCQAAESSEKVLHDFRAFNE